MLEILETAFSTARVVWPTSTQTTASHVHTSTYAALYVVHALPVPRQPYRPLLQVHVHQEGADLARQVAADVLGDNLQATGARGRRRLMIREHETICFGRHKHD
jgi:hypothetical protein